MMKFFLVLVPYLVSLFIIALLIKDNLKLTIETKEKEETIQILNQTINNLSSELKQNQLHIESITKQDFEGVPI